MECIFVDIPTFVFRLLEMYNFSLSLSMLRIIAIHANAMCPGPWPVPEIRSSYLCDTHFLKHRHQNGGFLSDCRVASTLIFLRILKKLGVTGMGKPNEVQLDAKRTGFSTIEFVGRLVLVVLMKFWALCTTTLLILLLAYWLYGGTLVLLLLVAAILGEWGMLTNRWYVGSCIISETAPFRPPTPGSFCEGSFCVCAYAQVEAQPDYGPGSEIGTGWKIGVTWSRKRSFKMAADELGYLLTKSSFWPSLWHDISISWHGRKEL